MKLTKGVLTANSEVETIVTTETSVYVRSNIEAVEEPGSKDMPGFTGYRFDETEYTKDEYIVMLSQALDNSNAIFTALLGGAE